MVTGLSVMCYHKPTRALFAAGEAEHHLTVGDQRGMRVPQSVAIVAGAHLPLLLTGLLV